MTKEESIAFAIKLQKDFTEKSTLEHQIESFKKTIDSPTEITVKKRSFFRFFWPVIPVTVVAYFISNSLLNYMVYNLTDKQIMQAINIRYLILIAIVVLGVIIAGVRTKNANKEYEYAVKDDEERKRKLIKDSLDLKDKLETLNRDLKQNAADIPSEYRNSAAMSKIKLMLQSGKAEDFDDALNQLKTNA